MPLISPHVDYYSLKLTCTVDLSTRSNRQEFVDFQSRTQHIVISVHALIVFVSLRLYMFSIWSTIVAFREILISPKVTELANYRMCTCTCTQCNLSVSGNCNLRISVHFKPFYINKTIDALCSGVNWVSFSVVGIAKNFNHMWKYFSTSFFFLL